MKVIFLDHDGVLCLPPQWGTKNKKERGYIEGKNISLVSLKFDNFDSKCVRILNEIINEADCEIVVSSDWRLDSTIEEMGEYYEDQGIIKKPIDFIHSIPQEEYKKKYNSEIFYPYEIIRADEIKKYLSEHPEITHWVAIDDMDMRYYLRNFVFTRFNEGIKQIELKDEIIKYLIDN